MKIENKGCGYNNCKQIGETGMVKNYNFVKMMEGVKVEQITCRADHSVVLKKDGTVALFGNLLETEVASNPEFKDIKLIMGDFNTPVRWSTHQHQNFDQEFQQSVFYFILSVSLSLPTSLKPPKPILAMILNFVIDS